MSFRRTEISRKVTSPKDHAGIEFSCTYFERVFGRLVNKIWIDIVSIFFSLWMNIELTRNTDCFLKLMASQILFSDSFFPVNYIILFDKLDWQSRQLLYNDSATQRQSGQGIHSQFSLWVFTPTSPAECDPAIDSDVLGVDLLSFFMEI